MPKQTIKVVAHVIAHTDKIPQVQTILQKIVAPTRQEAGCLSYQLLHHRNNPATFLFIEEWTDENAIAAHFGTPHIQQALAEITPLLAQAPDIQRYTLLA
ncbi:putative quinol monooxygenase [Nitrosomonas oligotropha]|uniref:putative quinol monooxygenase n=1 Tax=Nitrosomonas oligotropha TaxID=42354 RepID=UPI0013687481|nr:putative quinol monooxygenase [Nitrosomonas oligotropha]MXS82924.1 antibiotic biosynthesis monooxygenase [Nitrosomonas oligotropha]